MTSAKQPSIPNQPCLHVSGGRLNGRYVLLTGDTGARLLGSGPEAELVLEAQNVEAQHARVRWDASGVFLDDLSQQHEIFVNGERFPETCSLADGDRIWLGKPGDHDSVRVTLALPGHPRDYAEPEAPAAAEAEPPGEQWGAVDDDEELIGSAAPATAATAGAPIRAKAATGPIPALPPQPAAPHAPAPRPLPQFRARVAAKPPVPRAILVGASAALLGIAGFLWYARSSSPAPLLLTLLPPKAEPGHTVQITGTGFEARPEDNAVSFGDKPAEVTAASATQLTVTVPQGLPADDKPQHRVRVRARGSASNVLFFRVYMGPRVQALEPDVAMPGDVVTASGENFGDDPTVSVGGASAEVLELQPRRLRFRVPRLSVPSGKALTVGVQVGANSARATTLLIGKLPLVLELAPARGLPGERVTIKGRGFDPAPGGSQPWFGAAPALVLGASERELQVVVPGGGRLGGPSEVPVSVRVRGATSAGSATFQLARLSSGLFVPRFFPEPGTDAETVKVSTELGPFLILRGKGDAPSAAERAARAAAALNGVMEQAQRGPVAVALRENPLGVAAGAGPLLVAALPDDGFAYDSSRPSARALARYWTALLQDYVTLFAHKQRPTRVIELQSRGQALLELYGAAERRAGVGAGVPPIVVESLAPSQARALAELALNVPGESQGSSGAAVAGRWEGTLEESGQVARVIQVRLRATGAGLAGTLATRAGAVSGELPLQGPSYSAGVLRFGVKLGTTPLHFEGRLDGRSVAGELRSPDGRPRGRFSLRWVE